jgi:hypothetical protein
LERGPGVPARAAELGIDGAADDVDGHQVELLDRGAVGVEADRLVAELDERIRCRAAQSPLEVSACRHSADSGCFSAR